jgi:transposase-like protein
MTAEILIPAGCNKAGADVEAVAVEVKVCPFCISEKVSLISVTDAFACDIAGFECLSCHRRFQVSVAAQWKARAR